MGHKCCSKQKVKRGLWSPEEDEKLIKHITSHGHGSWSSVPKQAGLQRCGKSCRLRWINYLRPDLKRGSFSAQEERIIIDVHRILGNRWAQIAKHLPGRTDNEVKNFWNSCIKKKLIAQGLDPNTHNLFSPQYHQSITTNRHNLSHIPQQPTSVFSINEQLKDSPITLPYNFPQDSNYNSHPFSTITTSEYQEQINPHASIDQSASSLSDPMENLCGIGVMDENWMWGTDGFEAFGRPPRQGEILMQQPQPQVKPQQEKVSEMEIEKTIENHEMMISTSGAQNMKYGLFESCNMDYDFVESYTLMPSGMYYNGSPMDQLAWD